MVCNKALLDDTANEKAFQGFVAGWMKGVEETEKAPDKALDALVKTQEFFAMLAKDEGQAFVKSLFDNLVWTGLEDNARILGLAGGTNHYERVYKRFDVIYRKAGALADPNSPVIDPSDSFDYRFIKKLMAAAPSVKEEAAKPEFVFTKEESETAAKTTPTLTKPVSVNFAHGSAELTKRSQQTLDTDMVPVVESNGSAYFEVSGNTDSTGTRAANAKLSLERAQAVVKYLVTQWEFPAERFVVVGNGPDKPLCDEAKPEGEGLDLDGCRAANRATRVAVLSRGPKKD
jgi:outer membrane protein OmpA-like peptidoglycan-associated protein